MKKPADEQRLTPAGLKAHPVLLDRPDLYVTWFLVKCGELKQDKGTADAHKSAWSALERVLKQVMHGMLAPRYMIEVRWRRCLSCASVC